MDEQLARMINTNFGTMDVTEDPKYLEPAVDGRVGLLLTGEALNPATAQMEPVQLLARIPAHMLHDLALDTALASSKAGYEKKQNDPS